MPTNNDAPSDFSLNLPKDPPKVFPDNQPAQNLQGDIFNALNILRDQVAQLKARCDAAGI